MKEGRIFTPVLEDNALGGITRDTVRHLSCVELEIDVEMRTIDRSELYLADEVFLCGTAAHLMPVIRLDGRPVPDGEPGPITTEFQRMYFHIALGDNPSYRHWCTQIKTVGFAAS